MTFVDRLRSWFGLPPGRPAAQSEPGEATPPPRVVDALEEALKDPRLPESSVERALTIRAMIPDLDRRARGCGLLEEVLELQRLRNSHVPRLLESYVEIPPEHRADVFRETGRSASFLLNERLDKIIARLREMSRQLARGNLDEFAQNIRFVDMQYGASPFD